MRGLKEGDIVWYTNKGGHVVAGEIKATIDGASLVQDYITNEVTEITNDLLTLQECITVEDKVNHPNHYTSGAIEVIDYIKDQLTPEEFRGAMKFNIIKYVSREKHKNGDEDLEKAQFYLNFLLGDDPRGK